MHIAALHRAAAIILRYQLIAIIEEPRNRRSAAGLVQATERIITQLRIAAATGAHQAVLLHLDIAVDTVPGQVAVQIIAERRRACTDMLNDWNNFGVK